MRGSDAVVPPSRWLCASRTACTHVASISVSTDGDAPGWRGWRGGGERTRLHAEQRVGVILLLAATALQDQHRVSVVDTNLAQRRGARRIALHVVDSAPTERGGACRRGHPIADDRQPRSRREDLTASCASSPQAHLGRIPGASRAHLGLSIGALYLGAHLIEPLQDIGHGRVPVEQNHALRRLHDRRRGLLRARR